jgi:hypothetical protein
MFFLLHWATGNVALWVRLPFSYLNKSSIPCGGKKYLFSSQQQDLLWGSSSLSDGSRPLREQSDRCVKLTTHLHPVPILQLYLQVPHKSSWQKNKVIPATGRGDPKGRNAAGRIWSTEKSNDLIGNWTCDLPACSMVPQPTTLPRAPYVFVVRCLINYAGRQLRLLERSQIYITELRMDTNVAPHRYSTIFPKSTCFRIARRPVSVASPH